MTYIKTKLKKDIVVDSIITIHYFEYMKDFVFHGESHDFWEFLYVDKGSVLVRAGDDQFRLDTGDIIFHEPNEFHAIRSVGNVSPNLVVMSFTSASPAMDLFRRKYFALTMEERTLISAILNAAREAFSTPLHIPSIEQVKMNERAPFGAQQFVQLYLELFLLTVARQLSFRNSRSADTGQRQVLTAGCQDHKNQYVQEIISYMQFHICEQLTLDQLCEHFSLSRSALQKLFHHEMGCGPMKYFNSLKIDRSKEMIRDGNRNFTEIAGFLSYSSLSYFSKQFKKATGMSPMEYATSVKGISNALRGDSEKK